MGKLFAQTGMQASAMLRGHRVTRAYTSAPKFLKVAGLVGCPITGCTTVGTLDGAPMVRRWHHLEKAITGIGTRLMADTWR